MRGLVWGWGGGGGAEHYADELTEQLEEIMLDEFNTLLEDDSARQVAPPSLLRPLLSKLFSLWVVGSQIGRCGKLPDQCVSNGLLIGNVPKLLPYPKQSPHSETCNQQKGGMYSRNQS
jgi:Pre-rRNA-processing protein TSR2